MFACGLTACLDVGFRPMGDTASGPPPSVGEGVEPFDGPRPDAADIPPGWGAPPVHPPDAADALFEEGTIHRVDLELDDAARHALAADPRTDVPATLRFEDRSWSIGVQLKGSFSFRTLAGKAAWKIDFEQYVDQQRFFGLRRITLNNMVQDRSMIREHEAYWMYAMLGVPAPRHGYVELYVNGEPYGLYGLVETLDGTWAERVFPGDSEGPIYEGGYGADLKKGGVARFDLQRQGDLPEPYADLDALVAELDATEPEDLPAFLERHFDAPALYRMWAMDLVAGHNDGYVRSANNFLLYHALRSDRWSLIPWGQDQTLRGNGSLHSNYNGELAKECRKSPACKARLDLAIAYVADMWEVRGFAAHAEATGAAIEEACLADPRKEDPCGYGKVVDVIEERPDEVREELAEPDDD